MPKISILLSLATLSVSIIAGCDDQISAAVQNETIESKMAAAEQVSGDALLGVPFKLNSGQITKSDKLSCVKGATVLGEADALFYPVDFSVKFSSDVRSCTNMKNLVTKSGTRHIGHNYDDPGCYRLVVENLPATPNKPALINAFEITCNP